MNLGIHHPYCLSLCIWSVGAQMYHLLWNQTLHENISHVWLTRCLIIGPLCPYRHIVNGYLFLAKAVVSQRTLGIATVFHPHSSWNKYTHRYTLNKQYMCVYECLVSAGSQQLVITCCNKWPMKVSFKFPGWRIIRILFLGAVEVAQGHIGRSCKQDLLSLEKLAYCCQAVLSSFTTHVLPSCWRMLELKTLLARGCFFNLCTATVVLFRWHLPSELPKQCHVCRAASFEQKHFRAALHGFLFAAHS